MTQVDQLIQRGKNVHLNISLHPLRLASINPATEWLEDFIEDLQSESSQDTLTDCGMPMQELLSVIEEDAEDRDGLCSTLQEIGGWLITASVPGSQKMGAGSVMLHHWAGTQSVFWGQTQEAALEHAVKWAESLWGNNDWGK